MDRISAYLGLMKDAGVDALLLTGQVNRRYACGYDISEGMAILSPKGCKYFTDSRYIEDAERNLPQFDVRMVDREKSYIFRLQEAIRELSIATLGYEEEEVTAGCFATWNKKLDASLVPMQEEISRFRMVKGPEEISCIRRAQDITDKTFSDILQALRPGITEKQVYAELTYLLYQNGSDGPSFSPVVVSGRNTSMPHGVASDKVLEEGDFVTLDFGCLVDGYCSDMTRTVALGSVTKEMEQVYNIVLQAQLVGLDATRAGVSGRDIDMAARKVIENAGYGEFFGHGYGHGVGLEIHEAPNCSPTWGRPIAAGCVCSAEPGIYLPVKFGVRIEDLVIIRENGIENLTKSPKSLIIL